MPDKKTKNPQLSIIILNYKTDDLILNLLSHLEKKSGVEIIIVDNSPDNILSKKIVNRSDIRYFFIGKNLGFSGGNNFGIKRAAGDWILLLNSDTIVSTSDLLRLLLITQASHRLVAAPKLLTKSKNIQNNVGYFDGLFENPINYLFVRPRFVDCSKITSEVDVDLLTGAAMLIHRSVFNKVGLLDEERFFMYFEDIDFSLRLHKAGIKVLYVPSVQVVHLGGASSNMNTKQKNINYTSGLKAYLTKHRTFAVNYLNNIFHFFK